MNLRALRQLVSVRDLRNAAFGFFVVCGGVALAGLTLYAHRAHDARLAGIAAGTSLVFVLLILIFVVPPLARNASREASQLNLPFEFTSGGAVFLGLIAIVAFSAWNTGYNLLFLVLSFLTGALIVGFLAGGICLKKLDVRMRFPEIIFAGDSTKIMVGVHNRKRLLPSFSVVTEVRGRECETSLAAAELAGILPRRIAERIARPPIVRRTLEYFAHIPRNASIETNTEHVFVNRGRFLIKDFELSTRFPFGFFRHRRRLPARETELIVFPSIEPIDNALNDLPLEAGKIVAAKRGSGQDLLSLREYQPNDDLRRIDWKATARTRSLTVKEFSAEDDRKIALIFDQRIPRADGPMITIREQLEAEQRGGVIMSKRYESGLRLAASLLDHFSDQQAEICLTLGAEAGEFGVGKRHLFDCMRRIAVSDPEFIVVNEKYDPNDHFEKVTRNLDVTSHIFLVTAANHYELSEETLQKCRMFSY